MGLLFSKTIHIHVSCPSNQCLSAKQEHNRIFLQNQYGVRRERKFKPTKRTIKRRQ